MPARNAPNLPAEGAQPPFTTPALTALKKVIVARKIRDEALAAFIAADRALYDAEQDMYATRLIGNTLN